ncbi:MAG: hypothetical protein IJJ00_03575 [Erysipelotrichaceae bacterium]|nr:hypothetical protein [Erysipelotrichaceae bacterium]
MLLISELKLGIDESESELKDLIIRKLKINDKDLFKYSIYKRSLDARKEAVYKYQVLVSIRNEKKYLRIKNVSLYVPENTEVRTVETDIRPVIVGYGPSGIFAAYRLAEAGMRPIVFEKGKRIREREKDVERFFKEGILDPDSNVQFGEGGAGTFSDAKLTTRIRSPFIEYALDVFIRFGADEKIRYTPHAHIGTDEIRKIIERITDHLIEKDTEFHFGEEMKELLLNDSHEVIGITTEKSEYRSPICILGVGHSAYKTIRALDDQGVSITPKDIAIGFRVEHPQSLIDGNQLKGLKAKEPSEYFLRYKDDKGVYSFCMCPGGLVIPASSDPYRIVTNGMSYAKRDSGIANSAILVQVSKDEFPEGRLGGFEYLKEYEEKAYNVSGSYRALASNIKDYIENSSNELIFPSTYPLGTVTYDFNDFFSEKDGEYFKKALVHFDSKIPGFIEKGIMVGPETRSSSPVRINRNEDLESVNTRGLYPAGEGAGYGGGIMSCILDGIRIADRIIEKISESSV